MMSLARPLVHRAGGGRLRRSRARRLWIARIAGLLLLIAWVAALAMLTPDGERSGTVAIVTPKLDAHIEGLRTAARGAGLDYFLMITSRPLDEGLREYLSVRQGRL